MYFNIIILTVAPVCFSVFLATHMSTHISPRTLLARHTHVLITCFTPVTKLHLFVMNYIDIPPPPPPQ